MSPEQKQYERAFEIIEAYGADSAKWPQAERSSIEQCVVQSTELQAHLQMHAALDVQLNNLVVRPRLNRKLSRSRLLPTHNKWALRRGFIFSSNV